MARGYLTSSTLIDTVKREAMIPTSQSTFTEDDFLAMANQEIRIGMLPSIMQYHQEYLTRTSAPITIVAHQNAYPIPYRAVGSKFREVFYLDTSNQLRSMTRINPDDRPYYQQSNFQNRFIYFYLEGNEIVLLPDVGSNPTGSIIYTYYIRPNELVDESRIATITNISTVGSTTVYTVNQIPQNVATFMQGGNTINGFNTTSLLDILQQNPGHKTIAFDIKPIAFDPVNLTITFNTSDISSYAIPPNVGSMPVAGDYIAFAGECIIPQIPSDLHDVLCQRVVLRCLQSLGDAQGYQIAQTKLAEMEKYTGNLIDNRSEGQATKANNLRGILRSSKIRKSGWL